jgi:glycosyltransferase involved in cell wall biosynthesis
MESNKPFISCLLVTYNRREFIPAALRSFEGYSYPNLELIVVDDGTDPIEDLLPADNRIHYWRQHTRADHGSKMNAACASANAEYLAVHDDDDEYAPDRIDRLVEALNAPRSVVVGSSVLWYRISGTRQVFRYTPPEDPAPWIGAIMFRKDWWVTHKFKALPYGADLQFLKGAPRDRWVDLEDPNLAVCGIHAGNADRKAVTREPYFKAFAWEQLPKWFLDRSDAAKS